MSKILEYCKTKWSNRKCNGDLSHYYHLRNELFVENDLIYYNNRLIVPTSLRPYYFNLIHETHIGISKTKEKIRNLLYWPGVMKDVENLISNCKTCNRFSNFNQKNILQQRELPVYPF